MTLQFGAPAFLWLLLLIPAGIGFFWWSGRIRQRLMTQFIQARLLPGLLSEVSPRRRRLRQTLLLAGIALLVVALARPKWGFHLEEVRQRGLDIVIGMDTSRSMLASDVAPNRLARAKLEAIALQQLCRADRLGLVAFAGSAFLQCPLSLDDDAFRQGLEALDTGIIPQGGTALAEAIRAALAAFKKTTDNHKVLVLFTDGEDHDGQAVDAAKEAAKEGLRIFTVGVGSPSGELISVVDEQGRRGFLKDESGAAVKSRLNEPLLQEIARAANGFYLPLSGARTMDTLYERGLAQLPRTDSDVKTVRQYYERFQWFLGLALVLLLAEMLLPETQTRGWPRWRRPGAGAALLALLLSLTGASAASPAKALREYRRGNFEKALSEYEKLAAQRPDDPRVRFNTGAAAFREKQYDQALKEFSAALTSPDLGLQEKAYYNLGNTRYRLGEEAGDPKKQMSEWQQAVAHYESALKLDPKDTDATHNLEWVKKKLEELKQQQQQQKQDKDEDKNEQKKDQDQKQDQKQQQQDNQQNQQQDPQKQDQEKQDQQKEQDSQGQQGQQKQDDSQQGQQKQPEPKQDPGQDPKDQQAQPQNGQDKQDPQQGDLPPGKLMQMTPQQARQLLDAQRADEKPLPFWRLLRTNRVDRLLKDW